MTPPDPATPALSVLRPSRQRRLELQFQPAALEIVDTPASPSARLMAATLIAFFSAAVAWSVVGRVDIIATAQGVVVPAGKSKVVQPLESGVVRSILVQDGDHVAAGQTLIELDLTVAAAERDRLARDLRQARLDAAGLRALAHDIDAADGLASFEPPEGLPAREVAARRAAITAQHAEQDAKLAGLVQQIAQKRAETGENAAAIGKLQAALPVIEQKSELRRQLLHVEFGNRLAYLDAQQQLIEEQHELTVQQQRTGQIEAARLALERQLVQTQAGYVHGILKDLADAETKEEELSQQLLGAAHKAEQTVLAAPIAGTVQQLAVHTVGGVVTPAQELMTVVPDDAPVLVEASLENRDVGFVHQGQEVEVKVETFDFTRYGLLRGHVISVSRDAAPGRGQQPEDTGQASGKPYKKEEAGTTYAIQVGLEQASMDVDGTMQRIQPGMAVTAEVKSGSQTVISFLTSMLNRHVSESGHER